MELMELVGQLGVMAGLVVFFIWWSREREAALAKKIDELDGFIRDTLLGVLKENAQASAAQQNEYHRLRRRVEEAIGVMDSDSDGGR